MTQFHHDEIVYVQFLCKSQRRCYNQQCFKHNKTKQGFGVYWGNAPQANSLSLSGSFWINMLVIIHQWRGLRQEILHRITTLGALKGRSEVFQIPYKSNVCLSIGAYNTHEYSFNFLLIYEIVIIFNRGNLYDKVWSNSCVQGANRKSARSARGSLGQACSQWAQLDNDWA